MGYDTEDITYSEGAQGIINALVEKRNQEALKRKQKKIQLSEEDKEVQRLKQEMQPETINKEYCRIYTTGEYANKFIKEHKETLGEGIIDYYSDAGVTGLETYADGLDFLDEYKKSQSVLGDLLSQDLSGLLQ